MSFVEIPGYRAKLFVYDERKKCKTKCADCFSCQGCNQMKCNQCLQQKKCLKNAKNR